MSDLKNMALTKAERKMDGPAGVSTRSREKFPWGLSVDLDSTSLKKLGRKAEDFQPGKYVTLTCKAKCVRVSISTEEGGDDSRVALQIEAMTVETPTDKATAAHKKVFGDGK